MSLTENFDSLQKCINGMFRDVRDILADEFETPLETQMAQQLKEQARQLEELKLMVKSLLEAEEARKAEARKAEREAERKEAWSCPADGYAYPWTHKGTKYLRSSYNYVFTISKEGRLDDWKGIYMIEEDRIDERAKAPAWVVKRIAEKKAMEATKKAEEWKQRDIAEKKAAEVARKNVEERKQRDIAKHAMRQEEARKRSAAQIGSEYSTWNRYETPTGPPQELITRGHHVWSSDRTSITVDGKVCTGPRLGSYMGINFAGIHWSMCGISRGGTTYNGVTYDGTVEPRLY
jgi:hypothetical protein